MKDVVILEPKHQVASIDVDSQNSFTPLCPDELPVPAGHEIAEELNRQSLFAQYRLGSKDAHPRNAVWLADATHKVLTPIQGYINADVRWPTHCVPGTFGFELIQGLPHPQDYDYFVWKGVEPDMHPYGACYHDINETISTGLIEFLQVHKIKTVLVGGLATDYCVKMTVLQLLRAGFKTILNLSACKGLGEDTTQEAIHIMKIAGAIVIPSTQSLKQTKN